MEHALDADPRDLGRRNSGRPALAALDGLAATLAVVFALTLAPVALGAAGGVSRGVRWLASVQNADGGFGASPGKASDEATTGWAMLGLEAGGRNPLDVSRHGQTPIDFLRGDRRAIASSGDLARTILALEGAGVNPRSFAGRDLVAELARRRRRDGSLEDRPSDTALAVIARRVAGASGGLRRSLSWLRKVQNPDGGWGEMPGSPSTAEDTGAVLQALGSGSEAAARGLAYLRKAQRPGGGFPLGGGGPVNSRATAWAVQGIIAAGGDPGSFRRGGASALDYLAARQAPDGHYRYSSSRDQTPIWVTGEVLVAAAGKPFPLSVPPRAPKRRPRTRAPKPPASVPRPPTVTAPGGGGAGALRVPRKPLPAPPVVPETGVPGPVPQGGASGAPLSPGPVVPLARSGGSASPWPPLGIGAAAAALVLAAARWLGRRYDW